MANERTISVGIASFGMSGKIFHAPLLAAHPGYLLHGVVERSRNEASAVYPHLHVYRSFEELIGDPAIELVVVNTPDHLHAVHTRQAIEAGKHVVVEKPFTLRVEEGRMLLELARQKGRMLTVFQNRRWDGDFRTVRKVIAEGKLGRVFEYEAHFDRFRPAVVEGTWKEDPATGTGTLFNLGSHLIDQALVLFGLPHAVSGVVRIIRAGAKVDDWFDVRLHYPDVQVTLRASYLVPDPGPRYVVRGTEGSFMKWGTDPQEEALKAGTRPRGSGWGIENEETWGRLTQADPTGTRHVIVRTEPGDYSAFYDNVYDHLTTGAGLAVRGEDGLDVIRVIEAVRRSSITGQTIVWDTGKG